MDAHTKGIKSSKARKRKVVYKTEYYTISRIPLNYRIDISPAIYRKERTIDLDYYESSSNSLQDAIETAEYLLKTYFDPQRKCQFTPPVNNQDTRFSKKRPRTP